MSVVETSDGISFSPPIHPGVILREDFMPDYGLSAGKLAAAIGVPRSRVEMIVRGQRAITADTALRIGRYFGTTARFWLNLQAGYDLDRTQNSIEADLQSIDPCQAA